MKGIMGKAAAGLGQGLVMAGQMGYQAKIQGELEAQRAALLAKRDEVLDRYENQRLDKEIGARQEATRTSAAATTYAADVGRQTELDKQANEHAFKRGEPFKGEDGQMYRFVLDDQGNVKIGEDGSPVVQTVGGKREKWSIDSETGLKIEEGSGKTEKVSPQDGFMSKAAKDTDARIAQLRTTVEGRFGKGLLEKLNEGERADYDRLIIEGGRLIRQGKNIEEAYASIVDDLNRLKARKSKPDAGPGAGNLDSILNRFGVN